MAYKRVKTEDMEVNYKFSCRCCLKSEAEFFKLDSLIDCGQGDNDASTTKLPLLRLLLYCMRTENHPELPQYICVECRKSLQISYYFIQNSLRAHEILCRKLCPDKLKTKTRFNGRQLSPSQETRADAMLVNTHGEPKPLKSTLRHECKICGDIITNRLELRQHLRMHAESSRHKCKLCSFVTFTQRQLLEHNRKCHGPNDTHVEPQIKMRRPVRESASITLSPRANSVERSEDDGQVTVCTLEDMELLIPTVLTPEDFSHPKVNVDQLQDIELPLEPTITSNANGANVSIGAEFLVMPDGSLQQVNDGGVVFEYIDDSKNASTAPNVTLQSLLSDSNTDLTYGAMDIDVPDIVVDNALPQITVKPKPRPAPASIGALKHKCKLCPKAFPTVARLKSHQLTHSNLPKFYCDQCNFYSLRQPDLLQHYKSEHNVSVSDSKATQLDTSSVMMLTDRNRIFSCDMCLFETPSCGQLRLHYSDKHMIVPSEVQLRPSWVKERESNLTPSSSISDKQPDLPLGITYPSLSSQSEQAATMPAPTPTTSTMDSTTIMSQLPQATTTTEVTPDGINIVENASSLFFATTANTTTTTPNVVTEAIVTNTKPYGLFPEPSFGNSPTKTITTTVTASSVPQSPAAIPTTTTPNTSIFGDMQEFIDNTDVAAICTIPADDMPVVDGDDIVIDNNNISLEFDAEKLFEEFDVGDGGVDDEDEEDDDEDDDAENDDENDNNEAATDQNLLLTSDDDDVDDFDDEQPEHLQKPLCLLCNKKFTSQYKFENHMFLHRGLAPYRCELCTNLYNMKRLLIKHYKTVHKRMPTRDMVQAKGDKVSVPSVDTERINVQPDKSPAFMCAKCPFECELESEIRNHLISHHGINDGGNNSTNDTFFYRKLPYECPRCIRSFAAKRTLIRHLQRSHLVYTIIELQAPQLTTSSAATTTTSTATTTLPHNASDIGNIHVAPIDAGFVERSNINHGGEDEKCEEQTVEKGTESDTNKEIKASTTTTTTVVTSTTQDKKVEEAITVATTSADSTLFPTPTPFDFDLDFIGNEGHDGTSLKNNNVADFNDTSLPSVLLNGSDKLLPVALEPSPIKDTRSRLPRTPIYVCKQCNQTFDELSKLLQHELLQHSSGSVSPSSNYQHQCNICNTSYRTVTLLNYHMKRHAIDKVKCIKQEPKETHHPIVVKKIKTGNRCNVPLKCGIDGCNKTFNYKHHLTRHQTASHVPVKYMCPVCGRDMMTSLHLRNHMTTHRGTHTYKCPRCVRTYLRKKPFRRHALREHKWELTDAEISKMYCINESSPSKQMQCVQLGNVESVSQAD